MAAISWSHTGVDVVSARFCFGIVLCVAGRDVYDSSVSVACVHVFVVCVDYVRALSSDCVVWVSTGQ